MEEEVCFSLVDCLPDDIVQHLLVLLEEDQRRTLGSVSNKFSKLADSEAVWAERCQADKGLSYKLRGMSWKDTHKLDIKDSCVHLGKINREHMAGVWENLQALYSQKNLVCCSPGCGLERNTLWACLECRYVGCGRRYGAHALQHFQETGHMLSVKLLTLEFSCYVCEQWLGEEGRPDIERERVSEIFGWLESSCPATIQHRYMSVEMKKRRQVERSIRWADDNDPSWSVFPAKWYESWLDFIVGDSEPPTQPIDNSGFVRSDGKVAANISNQMVILSNEQWEYLSSVYSGGPHIQWDNVNHRWLVKA